jgi:hypothetical protein
MRLKSLNLKQAHKLQAGNVVMQSGSKFLLFASLSSTVLLSSVPALARGGGSGGHSSHSGGSVHVSGYYRSNGTYVHSYTRSAPHSGSGSDTYDYSPSYGYSSDPSAEVPQFQGETQDNGISSGNVTNYQNSTLDSTSAPTSEFQFPQPSCGDPATLESKIWYPVFVDNGNLEQIQQQYCQDALSTVRANTHVPTIQVASFTDRDKAVRFAQVVGGEVGEPKDYGKTADGQSLEQKSNSPSATTTAASSRMPAQSAQPQQNSSVDHSASTNTQAPATSNSQASVQPMPQVQNSTAQPVSVNKAAETLAIAPIAVLVLVASCFGAGYWTAWKRFHKAV